MSARLQRRPTSAASFVICLLLSLCLSARQGAAEASLTLPDALERTLERSPELTVFSWDLREAEARTLQAHARPNPDLIVEVEDVRLNGAPESTTRSRSLSITSTGATTGVGTTKSADNGGALTDAQYTVRLSQVIELGGKRARRVGLARQEQGETTFAYEVARLDALSETANRFLDVLRAQQDATIAEQECERVRQIVEAVEQRVEAGSVSPVELNKARNEYDAAQLALSRKRTELDVAKAALSSMWGEVSADFDAAIGDIDSPVELPTLDDSLGLLAESPDAARWNAAVESKLAALALSRAERKPDLTVEFGLRTHSNGGGSKDRGYTLDSGGTASFDTSSTGAQPGQNYSAVLGFSIPLPLFDRKKGAVLEAECAAEKARAEERRNRLQLEHQVRTTHTTLVQLQSTVTTLAQTSFPRSRDVLDKTREGYHEGKFSLLELLDAQRGLLDVEQALLEARIALRQELNTLERLCGGPGEKSATEAGNVREKE